ncbi:MAG: hypothetical protein F6K10_05395 [Moorea sp. SIO2B7]|nr:hypothetical protein [Moorena sp. SIO2B7]
MDNAQIQEREGFQEIGAKDEHIYVLDKRHGKSNKKPNDTRSTPISIFWLKSKGYLYSGPVLSIDEFIELQEGKKSTTAKTQKSKPTDLYCPIVIDTEFTGYTGESAENWTETTSKPSTEPPPTSKTITVQAKFIDEESGAIYHHPDAKDVIPNYHQVARHPEMADGFAPMTHLKAHSIDCKLTRNPRLNKPNRKPDLPILEFALIGHFLLAELYRITTGDYRGDVDKLVRSKNDKNGIIKMGRRLVAQTFNGNGQVLSRALMPWVIEIDSHQFQVALSFIDTCAIHGKASYAKLCKNSGVKLNYKANFNKKEISRMDKMYTERPKDYDDYALGDLEVYKALMGNLDKYKVIYKSLGIEEFFEPPRLTIGATVANIFRSKLLQTLGLTQKEEKKLIEYLQHGTAAHLKKFKTTTAVYLAKIDGGRCRNNKATASSVTKLLADIDIKGCYGNGLRHQDYPVGRPSIIDYPIDSDINEYQTLRKFLKKYRKDLVPGLWMARVSVKDKTLIKYIQDFLVSWIPPRTPSKLPAGAKYEDTDWFTEDNIGTIKVYHQDIQLAVITHEFLEWLEHTCSKHQRKELLDNLIVITAAIYPKSEECKTFAEFEEKVANHKGKNTTSLDVKRGKTTITKREQECKAWFRLNIGDLLINALLAERAKYDKKDPLEGPLNELYKLNINTLYGDMVSPFFDIGNVIVGNNITARARAMAWYMEKGLNGYQTITDGCIFDPNRIITARNNRTLTAQALTQTDKPEYKPYFKNTTLSGKNKVEYILTGKNSGERVDKIKKSGMVTA